MPRPQDIGPTYTQIMGQLLDSANGPIPMKDFIERVLALRPSKAKNPANAVKTQIRQEVGRSLVYLDKDYILPARLAMKGVRFRIQLDSDTASTGWVDFGDYLSTYLPARFRLENIRLLDVNGHPVEFDTKEVNRKEESFLGTFDNNILYADLGNWLHTHNAHSKDYILFTLFDWQNGVFLIEYEQYAKRDVDLLKQRNQLLADSFYTMLEDSTNEELYVYEAVPTVYARLPDKSGYPPDHWIAVLENDKRMTTDFWSIRYSEGDLPPFMELIRRLSGEPREIQKIPVSKEQGKQVFRFKAEFKHNPKIWREIEILGKQTLADLNSILVNGFNHDSDHLGGFWKLVPRKGNSGKIRYREVDLGDVDPLGEGDGADIKIAEIGLSEGDKVKFVYDFGDWIEHVLTLEAIVQSQTSIKYPRETARNKPKYVNCVSCAEESKQTAAEWICITCSNQYQKDMVYCEKCAESHEDHYLEEITY